MDPVTTVAAAALTGLAVILMATITLIIFTLAECVHYDRRGEQLAKKLKQSGNLR